MKIKRQIRREQRREWRVNPNNTPRGWKKVAKIAGLVAGAGVAVLATIATMGLAIPVVVTTVSLITAAAGSVATTAALTKKDEIKE